MARWQTPSGWQEGAGRAWGLCLGLVLCACGGESDYERSEPDTVSGTLEFGTCPAGLPGSKRGRACAVTEVPLRWDEPDGQQIELLVARYRSDTPNQGQLWLLDGGPGGTGAVYMLDQVLELYASLGLDLYIPQHRGTGYSTPLVCNYLDEVSVCGNEVLGAWGDGLRGFHSTEAGRDVGYLIERTREPGERAFVFGLSYGSYWAQRYLQAFPNQADGVILEGVFPLGGALWASDVLADAAGRSLFQACRDEPACAAAFGDADPEDTARAVLAVTDDPALRCFGEEGVGRVDLEFVLSLLVVADLGHTVPGLVRRFDRCSSEDQADLLGLSEFFTEALGGEPDTAIDNPALGAHVARTDIMAELSTFPLDAGLAAREPLVIWSGAGTVEGYASLVEGWPVNYPPAPTSLDGLDTPLLFLNGGLDIQTPSPWARELSTALGAPLVEFPFVGHGVDVSLAQPFTVGDAGCSLGIQRAFIADPGGAIDGSCAATAYTPDMAGRNEITQAVAELMYGRETPLLGSEIGAPRAKRVASPARKRDVAALASSLRERLRRALRELGGRAPRGFGF